MTRTYSALIPPLINHRLNVDLCDHKSLNERLGGLCLSVSSIFMQHLFRSTYKPEHSKSNFVQRRSMKVFAQRMSIDSTLTPEFTNAPPREF
jgi:hypothetical protein